MAQRYLAPSTAGLRQPTDPKKDNGMVVNPPRYLEMGGLDRASKTAASVSNSNTRKNEFAIVKPGKGSSR
ncbi:MAG TPA: hypothetical protein VMU47_10955 [Caldimonas sp.]|nr:hypothetical protein [Caldimonas sp.]